MGLNETQNKVFKESLGKCVSKLFILPEDAECNIKEIGLKEGFCHSSYSERRANTASNPFGNRASHVCLAYTIEYLEGSRKFLIKYSDGNKVMTVDYNYMDVTQQESVCTWTQRNGVFSKSERIYVKIRKYESVHTSNVAYYDKRYYEYHKMFTCPVRGSVILDDEVTMPELKDWLEEGNVIKPDVYYIVLGNHKHLGRNVKYLKRYVDWSPRKDSKE